MHRAVSLAVVGFVGILLGPQPASAARLENPIAVFAALDKVTARISLLQVPLNETMKFGALKVTPRACYSRPPTETPKTTAFVEIEELLLDGAVKRLFTGWMFAESPGLNAVEHPVFDLWLTGCKDPNRTADAFPEAQQNGEAATVTREPPRRRRRRRIRQ